jgi:hypothetical protein
MAGLPQKPVKGEASFAKTRDKTMECREAPRDPLNPFEVLNRAHLCDGRNLLQVGLDATLGNDETEQHSPWNPENAFLDVEPNAVHPESSKGLLNQLVGLFGFDYDVIHISLDGSPDEVPKILEHEPLVRGPCVLQAKWHGDVAIRSEEGDEGSHELVELLHHDLIVSGGHIKEAKGFEPRGQVDYLVYARKRKRILRACLVETRVLNTHSPFLTLFSYKNRIC